ncbi:MAG: glycoside hydrolase domain-containing protein, partial [bacterium]
KTEVRQLLEADPKPFYLFPEQRDYPIRMCRYLPQHWIKRGLQDTLTGTARRGEYFIFQIGVYAAQQPLNEIKVTFAGVEAADGRAISKNAFTCFNTEGVNQFGQPFRKSISVEQGEIQPLWIGVQISRDARPGRYLGAVRVAPKQSQEQTLHLDLQVMDAVVEDKGDSQPEKMSRLRWLNSTIGTDPDFIVAPYTPVKIEGKTLRVLGREIVLGGNGLPKQIRSYFTQEMTGVSKLPAEILAQPVELKVKSNAGSETWQAQPFEIEQVAKGRAMWTARNESPFFSLRVDGALEYEGMLSCKLTLVAKENFAVTDVALPVAMAPDAARYILGLGFKGQRRPERVDWKWDVTRHHEGVWLGAVNKGLQYVLRDENYERPLNTNFYQAKPLNMPESWYNDGKGGIRIRTTPDAVIADNYSGARRLRANDSLHFNIRLLITPFKPLDTRTHFNTRFVHKYAPVDSVKAWGGTVVNIHHANEINPYINYPFYNLDEQSAYIREAHQKGVKVKLYYTIRELTYKCYELFALRSLGDEILNGGDGDGHPWLQEHLQDHYHKGWHAWRVDDAAILNKGASRWTNYYVEGLNWLAKNQQIDGLYLDDIAFSRETVKRMMSVLHRHRDEVVIDLHSANQFNNRDGFINSAFLYMEHLPFVSRLWFGEYFEYDRDADYWLTEVSGIPFGLMGEMLEKGGHPYRGMLYGMTTRLYGTFDPRPIWKLFDEFSVADSRMVGYWVEPNPVRTGHPRVLATAYVKSDAVLIALASWAPKDVDVRLAIDWKQLGFSDAGQAAMAAPEVAGLQAFQKLDADKPVRVPKEQGLFVILEKR